MHLTHFTDYALRVLMALGVQPEGRTTIQAISEAYGISRNHLMKVVSTLTRLGYVDARRGPGGGLTLARPPAEINLADVIRQTEDDFSLAECFRDDGQCVIRSACRLRGIFSSAVDAWFESVGQHTLADLVEPPGAVPDLLGIPCSARVA